MFILTMPKVNTHRANSLDYFIKLVIFRIKKALFQLTDKNTYTKRRILIRYEME